MEVLRISSILWSLLSVMVMFMLLCELRFSARKNIIISCASMIPLIVLVAVMFGILGKEPMSKLIFAILTVPSFIFFFFMAKKRDGAFFFTFCLVDTIGFEIIVLTSLLDDWFGGGKFILMFFLRLVIFPILVIVVWKYIRTPYREVQKCLKKSWWLFALVSLLYYVLLAIMVASPVIITERPDDVPAVLFVFLLMPLTYGTILKMLFDQKKMHDSEEMESNISKQTDLLRNEFAAEKEFVNRAKQNRHDMRHNVQIIRAYLENCDYDGAKQYLSEYEMSISSNVLTYYCENKVVNAVFRIAARRCEREGIKFTCCASVPDDLPYTIVEGGTLFGNLMENACESAAKCKDPFLNVTAECKEDKLCVEIKNSVSVEVEFKNGMPVSTKDGGGIGLKSVNEILEEHGGTMRMFQNNDSFVTQIIQPL